MRISDRLPCLGLCFRGLLKLNMAGSRLCKSLWQLYTNSPCLLTSTYTYHCFFPQSRHPCRNSPSTRLWATVAPQEGTLLHRFKNNCEMDTTQTHGYQQDGSCLSTPHQPGSFQPTRECFCSKQITLGSDLISSGDKTTFHGALSR